MLACMSLADSECSMAVVNCADYPDLCSSYGIVHYPTVLLFRASPNDWTPYKGMMDSRQMLKVLLHQEQAEEKTDTLVSCLCIFTNCRVMQYSKRSSQPHLGSVMEALWLPMLTLQAPLYSYGWGLGKLSSNKQPTRTKQI